MLSICCRSVLRDTLGWLRSEHPACQTNFWVACWWYNEGLMPPPLRHVLRQQIKPRLRRLRETWLAAGCAGDLTKLAVIYRTDKWNLHWYAQHYARHFHPRRLERLHILEIGVGGYENPRSGGNSLRMWKAYFPHSRIYAIDCYDKRAAQEGRITIFQGRQEDAAFLRAVAARIGRIDLVIDDGSHLNRDVIASFETLFPLLDEQGIYVVEDTQTSYWTGFGGSSEALEAPTSTMGYFKRLIDGLNYEERLQPGYQPSYCDRHIVAMHFYHNMVFIMKGRNAEGSNLIRQNTTDLSWVLHGPDDLLHRTSPPA